MRGKAETARRPNAGEVTMAVILPPGILSRSRLALLGLLLAPGLLFGGCVRISPPPADFGPPVVFPLPPERARVQYLGSLSSSADLPQRRSGFADYIVGSQERSFPLVKPVAALLAGGKLYVCDTVLNTVVVYNLENGETHRLAGDAGIGKIRQPNNLAVGPDGRFYVADKLRKAVLVYGPDEQFLHAWGRPDEAVPVAVAPGPGVLYVCDIEDHEVEVWDSANGAFLRAIGGKGRSSGRLTLPTHLALDASGNLYVSDTGNFRVQKFSPEGELLALFGKPGTTPGSLAWPKGVAVDGHGRLYVADSRFANVQVFDSAGRLLLFFGGPDANRGNLHLPAGIRVAPWPSLPWLDRRVMADFDPEYLLIVVNQWRTHMVSFFAVAREEAGGP